MARYLPCPQLVSAGRQEGSSSLHFTEDPCPAFGWRGHFGVGCVSPKVEGPGLRGGEMSRDNPAVTIVGLSGVAAPRVVGAIT